MIFGLILVIQCPGLKITEDLDFSWCLEAGLNDQGIVDSMVSVFRKDLPPVSIRN